MLQKLGQLCKEAGRKAIKSEGPAELEYWQSIMEGFLNTDISEEGQKLGKARRKMLATDNKRASDFTEKKLEAIKQILGEDIVNKLEDYELENILKGKA